MKESKQELRAHFKARRKALDAGEMDRLNSRIRDRFLAYLEERIDRVSVIHIFLPIQKHREVDTWRIIEGIRERFQTLTLAVPRTKMGHEEMEAIDLESAHTVTNNSFSIPEPAGGQKIDPRRIDMIVLPLLAYDKKGDRVGYGGGFYDRFLKKCRSDVLKTGVSFFEPVSLIRDKGDHDIVLDHCVTPETVHSFDE